VDKFETQLSNTLKLTNLKLSTTKTLTELKTRLRTVFNNLSRGERITFKKLGQSYPELTLYIPKRASKAASVSRKKSKSSSVGKKKKVPQRLKDLERFLIEIQAAVPDLITRPVGETIEEIKDMIDNLRYVSDKDISDLLEGIDQDMDKSESPKVNKVIAKYKFINKLWSR
jgi:hypothetical protein